MVRSTKVGESHVMVFPHPLQGHINPMLQFSKRLASKGLNVTFITTTSIKTSVQQTSSINIDLIFGPVREEGQGIGEFLKSFESVVSDSLSDLIEKYKKSGFPVKAIVYDSIMPWTQTVADRFGIDGGIFFTVSCAVSTICYHFKQGTIKFPVEDSTVSLPSMPVPLDVNDLPTLLSDTVLPPELRNIVLCTQFSNFQKANWVFFNTFDKLEDKVVRWMASQRPIKTTGPAVPSMWLDKKLEDDKDYGISLFEPNADICMNWLDTKDIGSVVYVSFGSLAVMGEEQVEEITWGLRRINSHFLWVVRELEEKKLPSKFIEETSEKGLVVSWCPQLQVLAHKAVGCFMTHCGWNSTMEALCLGLPMVAMPQWTDQRTNAKFVEDVWRVGVRVKVDDEKGIVKGEEIEKCIREVMEGEKGKEMKKNVLRLKELAMEAVNEGGSSDENIEDFVAVIVST